MQAKQPQKLYEFMNRHNLEIALGQVRWQTARWNESIVLLVRGSRLKRSLFSLWFAAGAWTGLVMMVSSVVLLVYNTYSLFYLERGESPLMSPLVSELADRANHRN